ncbi:hypothetical protein GQ53DRAFT_820579 [Thozetella sp. PMI_491]|nr:hypothetical protein GQ53DRAFT_820579 [Thozetella sp. PMI_491]
MASFSTTQFSSTKPTAPFAAAAPLKRKTMSITQTYYLAHKARAKLSSEAAQPDHNLRLLVGHANLLDSLMLELADAEREQESWFNQSVRASSRTEEKERHIQWADTVIEEPEEDWSPEDAESESDSDSEFDAEEDIEMADAVPLRRIASHQPTLYDDMQEDDDDEEDFAQLTLRRSPSHSASPPELDHDEDSSEDESMPPSPPTAILATFSEKEQEIDSHDWDSQEKDAFDGGFYLPPRNPARLVTAISVY